MTPAGPAGTAGPFHSHFGPANDPGSSLRLQDSRLKHLHICLKSGLTGKSGIMNLFPLLLSFVIYTIYSMLFSK